MWHLRLSPVLILLLANCIDLFAESYYSKQIDINEGLSQPSVTCILSDRQGSVWIGTRFGLNKYRSNRIQNFGSHPSDSSGLKGNYIYSLFLDSENRLWTGTEQGLSVKDGNSDRFTLLAGQTTVYSACETEECIYFGSSEGIHKYDKSTGRFIRNYAPLESAYIVRIFPLRDGRFLVVDRGLDLFLFSPEKRSLEPYSVPGIDYAILMDGCFYDGLLYLAVYNKGLYAVDLEKREVVQVYDRENSGLTFDVILSLLEIDGQLWIGTDGGGLCRLDRGEISRVEDIGGADEEIIAGGSFTCLYDDPLGAIWTGSVRNGAFSLKTTDIRLFTGPQSGSKSVINDIWKDHSGTVWIGTDGQGVHRYLPGSGTLTDYPGPEGLKIHSLCELNEKTLLLSVYSQGLQTFDKETGRRRPFIIINPEINAQECSSGGSPMVYTIEDGILIFAIRAYLYNPVTGSFHRFNDGQDTPDVSEMSLFGQDARGFLYAFSKSGIFRIDVKQFKIERILSVSGKDAVNSAALSADGTIWVGSDSGLKYLLPGETRLMNFHTNLFTRVTQLKTWRDAHLWIAADNLLFRMDGEGQMVILDESDGFPANEIIASATSNTENDPALYLGGTRGFVEIQSSAIQRVNQPFQLELYEVSCGEKRLECYTGGKIRIPWNYGSLSIGINLRGIEPYRKELYRFIVDGNGPSSITETYTDRLHLPGLTDGRYQISVSYLMRDGSWSEAVQMLDIRVTPPWYRTWWFYTLLVLAALSLVSYLVFRYNEKSKKTLASTLSRWVTTSVDYREDDAVNRLSPQEKDLVKKVNRYVEEHLADVNLNVAAIARETAMSRASLYTKLKAVTGMGVAQYVEDLRIRRACHLLKETQLSIAEISEQVGFSTPNYFSMRFKQAVGISPLTFRKNSPV